MDQNVPEGAIVTASTPESHGEFLARMAVNPNVDAEKLKVLSEGFRLGQEQQRAWAKEDKAELARLAYAADFARMQGKLPVLDRDQQNQEGKGKFVDYGDAVEQCSPIWSEYGFGISFPDAILTPEKLIRLTCRVTHRDGHIEIHTAPDSPPDTVGLYGKVNKTDIQGNQSTITYLQRGLLFRALGIAAKREDDDGNAGGKYRRDDRHDQSSDGDWREQISNMVNSAGKAVQDIERKRSSSEWVNRWADQLYACREGPVFIDLVTKASAEATLLPDIRELDSIANDIMSRRNTQPDTRSAVLAVIRLATSRLIKQEKDAQAALESALEKSKASEQMAKAATLTYGMAAIAKEFHAVIRGIDYQPVGSESYTDPVVFVKNLIEYKEKVLHNFPPDVAKFMARNAASVVDAYQQSAEARAILEEADVGLDREQTPPESGTEDSSESGESAASLEAQWIGKGVDGLNPVEWRTLLGKVVKFLDGMDFTDVRNVETYTAWAVKSSERRLDVHMFKGLDNELYQTTLKAFKDAAARMREAQNKQKEATA